MRRLFLMFVLAGVLAGCSSGTSNVASPKSTTAPTGSSSTTPKTASSTAPKGTSKPTAAKSPKVAATKHKVIIGGATSFCGAFKELQSVNASDGAATASAVYRAAAADMRTFAPAAIKSAALEYANVIDDAGKALKAGTMPTSKPGKPAVLASVTVWVSKNCPKK
jgi:hypothetical protein